jgi:uncharacterized membrane protein
MSSSNPISVAATNSAALPPDSETKRIISLDFVRGVAMLLMAIDHVRVYSGLPAGGPTPGIFFTRWITHFVAPAFVFLAGTSIFLHGRKLANRAALSRFLLIRGAWLILLELTILRIAWTFNFDFAHYLLAGVIWMLGWCMIIMAGLVYLPVWVNATAGVAIIALHNLTDVFSGPLQRAFGADGPNWFLNILYFGTGSEVKIGGAGPPLIILFVIVPWIGVMMAGYAFGSLMSMPSARRRTVCLRLGVAVTLLFIILRAVNVYGDPRPWRRPPPVQSAAIQTAGPPAPSARPARPAMPTALSFLNTTKYPASLLFLLMTLGPMFILLSFAEGWRGSVAQVIATFGRVPMFYYLLHIPLIHFAACVVSLIREGHINSWLFANHPMAVGPAPAGYTWSLALLYLVYVICVTLLSIPCRWYARLRATRKSKWLTYL